MIHCSRFIILYALDNSNHSKDTKSTVVDETESAKEFNGVSRFVGVLPVIVVLLNFCVVIPVD